MQSGESPYITNQYRACVFSRSCNNLHGTHDFPTFTHAVLCRHSNNTSKPSCFDSLNLRPPAPRILIAQPPGRTSGWMTGCCTWRSSCPTQLPQRFRPAQHSVRHYYDAASVWTTVTSQVAQCTDCHYYYYWLILWLSCVFLAWYSPHMTTTLY